MLKDAVIYADSEEMNGFAVWLPFGFTGSKTLPFLMNGGLSLILHSGPGIIGRLLTYEISKLPDSLRETMQLRHLANFAYEEIASIQNCQLGTIKSRLSRGRELLLKRLKYYGITPGK